MEQDILDQLYYGKIVPWENRRGNTPEMDSLSGQVDQDIQWLKRRCAIRKRKCWDAFWRMLQNWNGCRSARDLRMDSGLGYSL